MNRLRLRLGGSLTGVAATALVLSLVVAIGLYLSFGSTTSSFGVFGDEAVALDDYRSLTLGSSQDAIERRLGSGQDALEFRETGVALEPIDADCTYYAEAGTGNFRDIIQLCFRNDELVRKRTYAATPGLPLTG